MYLVYWLQYVTLSCHTYWSEETVSCGVLVHQPSPWAVRASLVTATLIVRLGWFTVQYVFGDLEYLNSSWFCWKVGRISIDFLNFGTAVRRIFKVAGNSVKFHWPIFNFFVLVLRIFVSYSSYLIIFYPIISLICFMPSPAIWTNKLRLSTEWVLRSPQWMIFTRNNTENHWNQWISCR